MDRLVAEMVAGQLTRLWRQAPSPIPAPQLPWLVQRSPPKPQRNGDGYLHLRGRTRPARRPHLKHDFGPDFWDADGGHALGRLYRHSAKHRWFNDVCSNAHGQPGNYGSP